MSGYLRLFLALCVIQGHAIELYAQSPTLFSYSPDNPILFLSSQDAVRCFYVLSGFFIALVLNEKYGSNLGAFYLSRMLRIFPAYWAMLGVVAFLALVSGMFFTYHHGVSVAVVWGAAQEWSPLNLLYIAFANLMILGQDLLWLLHLDANGLQWAPFSPYVNNGPAFSLNVPAFSLAIELMFYAAAPWVLSSLPRTLLLLAVASIITFWCKWQLGYSEQTLYYLLPANLIFFVLGALAYYRTRSLCSRHLFLLLLNATIIGMVAFSNNPVYLTCGVLCLALARFQGFWQRAPLSRFCGDLAYLVYITHYPLMQYLLYYDMTYLLEATTLAVSLLIYLLVEKPKMRWLHRRKLKFGQ